MEESKENALQVAFEKAEEKYTIESYGIYVLKVLDDSPAEQVLKPGDRIIRIDDRSYESSKGFWNIFSPNRRETPLM